MSELATTIVGLCLPSPWSPSFVLPVFESDSGPAVLLIDDAGKVTGLEPVSLGEEFIPFTRSLPCSVERGSDGLFAAWLPSRAVVIGSAPRLEQAIRHPGASLAQGFPRFLANVRELSDSIGGQLAGGLLSEGASQTLSVAMAERSDIEDAPAVALLDVAPGTHSAYPPNWPQALLASRLDAARWARIADTHWMSAGHVPDEGLAVEWFLFSSDGDLPFERHQAPLAEVLAFLGRHWDSLCLESGPAQSEEHPREWWDSFRERHFLATTKESPSTPAEPSGLWFVVEDDRMALHAQGGRRVSMPLLEWATLTERFLDGVGLQIAQDPAQGDASLLVALELWRRRDEARKPLERLQIFAGIEDPALLERIVGVEAANVSSLLRHDNELLAAARMRPHECPAAVMHAVFDAVQTIAPRPTEALDALTQQALEHFDRWDASNEAPYESGWALARWLRATLDLSASHILEPRELLHEWNVEVLSVELDTMLIDAIGFWGPRHGPGIILNKRGHYAKSGPARRATLAHEICHLLIDRRRSLPLVDVMGGKVEARVEARARAFAAELLVPQSLVYERYLLTDRSIHELGELVGQLTDEFKVSRWIAGFQIKNALVRHGDRAEKSYRAAIRYVDALVGPD